MDRHGTDMFRLPRRARRRFPRRGQPRRRGRSAQDRTGVHHLERRPGDPLELVQLVVVPAGAGCPLEEPVRPVVGHHQAVGPERLEQDAGLPGEARDVVVGSQPEPQPHRWQIGIGAAGGEVGGRVDVAALGAGERDAHGVVDAPGLHLLAAHQAGEDRQPGGVGRGPAVGPPGVRAQVERGAVGGVPAATVAARLPELVQPTRALLHHDRGDDRYPLRSARRRGSGTGRGRSRRGTP